jgi:molybdopterin-synthase adenylyltransferase
VKNHQIKFPLNTLDSLRSHLLKTRNKEQYAVLFGKTHKFNDCTIITIKDIFFPQKQDYLENSSVYLKVKGSFVGKLIYELNGRLDVDTLIEVHTHPFTEGKAIFSGVDDQDETMFVEFLHEHQPKLRYASIVFSLNEYSARIWKMNEEILEKPQYAKIVPQSIKEYINNSMEDRNSQGTIHEMQHRTGLALGKNYINSVSKDQIITIIGLGGTGSVVFENLIHMGFTKFQLIDHDRAEVSNLNRVVGLTYSQAILKSYKVDCLKEHGLSINPNISIDVYPMKIAELPTEEIIARSSWLIMATDNHYSRYQSQNLAFKYYVPYISLGVSIVVQNDQIKDISAETILIRIGDHLCLKCLGRLNFNEIAKELNIDPNVRKGLVEKGYVQGDQVKDPAIKTINAIIGAMAVDQLVNQYTLRQGHQTIIVYENNQQPIVFEDHLSLKKKYKACNLCGGF